MKDVEPENLLIYSDIDGHKINCGTIPVDILTTRTRPDIVLISRAEKKTDLLELSCSFDKNLEKGNLIKTKKYLDLKIDLEQAGWKTHLVPLK